MFSKSLDELPTEVMAEILVHLDLNCLLKCRLVNNQWKFVVENNIKIKSLHVTASQAHSVKKCPFILKSTGHSFNTSNINFLQARFIATKMLKNIKKLCIHYPYSLFDQASPSIFSILESLNQFVKLEHLQIYSIKLDRPGTLKLPNLKFLSIAGYSYSSKFTLDTPLLHSLKIKHSISRIEFKSYDSVKSLSLPCYESEVQKFFNLEYLYIKYLENFDENQSEMPFSLLTLLPKLRELHFSDFEARKDIVYHIMLDKMRLSRSDFKFYCSGIRIDESKDLDIFVVENDPYLIAIENNFRMITQNYSKLSCLVPWIYTVNYTDLYEHFEGEIESDFHKRFPNVNSIIATKIENKNQFIEFIKKFEQLGGLQLNGTTLDQSFYDQLHNHQPNLYNLNVSTHHELDLGFILKLKRLSIFTIDQQVPFSLIWRAFNMLEEFNYLKFLINNKVITVHSLSNDARGSNYIFYSDRRVEFKCRDELFEFLDNLLSSFE